MRGIFAFGIGLVVAYWLDQSHYGGLTAVQWLTCSTISQSALSRLLALVPFMHVSHFPLVCVLIRTVPTG